VWSSRSRLPHRQDALAACRKAIDKLKETVLLPKKEVYEGETELGFGAAVTAEVARYEVRFRE